MYANLNTNNQVYYFSEALGIVTNRKVYLEMLFRGPPA